MGDRSLRLSDRQCALMLAAIDYELTALYAEYNYQGGFSANDDLKRDMALLLDIREQLVAADQLI